MRRPVVSGLVLILLLCGPLIAEETPRTIVERAVKAMGGAEAMENTHGHYMKLEGNLSAGPNVPLPGPVRMVLETRSMPGNKHNSTGHIEMAGSKVELGHIRNGNKGWTMENGQGREWTEEELKEREQSSHEDRVVGLLPLLSDPAYTLKKIEGKKVLGRAAVGIRVSCKNQPDVNLYFDQETGLLCQFTSVKKRGQESNEEISTLSDYRVVDFAKQTENALKEAKIATGDKDLLAYLARQTPNPEKVKRVKQLVQELADDDFEVREKATEELIKLGPVGLPLLRKAALDKDAEVARRGRDCIKTIEETYNPEMLRRVVRLLGLRKPPEAVEALLLLAPGADAALTTEIRVALLELAGTKGSISPALERALQDRDAEIRTTAEVVLGRDGGAWLKRAGRPLFPTGIKLPYTMSFQFRDNMTVDVKMVDFQVYNSFEDKWFAPPK